MKVLMIYPKYPDTYWSFKYALKFISKKAAVPPLGLITISAMLPDNWEKKLIDLNIEKLKDEDIKWADYIFLSGMCVQKKSINEILFQCKKYPVKIVAGGPLFTQEYNDYPQVDHFILNEGEITLPLFLSDLEKGFKLKKIYRTKKYADLSLSPIPDFDLLKLKAYASMSIQVSRGCPFSCDFCEITTLLGHKVRIKSQEQIIKELDKLLSLGWKGGVSVVDDNFIGNIKYIKNKILPSMVKWMKLNRYPFSFNAQTSINMADDDKLLKMMREAGFTSTFIGIETPVEESLHSCHKIQNENRHLLDNVKHIQKEGIQVSAGFIVGFDSDTDNVFKRQIDFIQGSGIVSAMVGLLNAPKNTRLYKQMENENRLTDELTGNNTDFTMNFIPKMDSEKLKNGYLYIINSIYKEKPYYKRVRQMLLSYNPVRYGKRNINFSRLKAFFKSIFILGIIKKGRYQYWKFIIWTLINKPVFFIDALTLAVYGYHFRIVYGLRSAK